MGDFKIQGITPAAEKLKLGSLNVSKIYNGSTLVWPIGSTTPASVKYGFLYNWYAANDSRNIANTGWSVPTINDQKDLSDFLGTNGIAGGKMKESGLVYWNSPNAGYSSGATNSSNFNGRGAGKRNYATGVFSQLQVLTYMWAQGEQSFDQGYIGSLDYNSANFTAYKVNPSTWYTEFKREGISVRLIKDTTSLTNGQTGTYTGNDGKVYRTICIGTQEWVADHLVETKYRNLDAIPEVTPNATWTGLSTGARCSYDNDPGNAIPTGQVEICGLIWTDANSSETELIAGGNIPILTNQTDWYSAWQAQTPAACYWDFDSNNASYGLIYNYFTRNLVKPPAGFRLPTVSDWNTLKISPCFTNTGGLFNRYGANPGNWDLTKLTNTTELGNSGLNIQGYGDAILNPSTNLLIFQNFGDWGVFFTNNQPATPVGDGFFVNVSLGLLSSISLGDYNARALFIRFVKNV